MAKRANVQIQNAQILHKTYNVTAGGMDRIGLNQNQNFNDRIDQFVRVDRSRFLMKKWERPLILLLLKMGRLNEVGVCAVRSRHST